MKEYSEMNKFELIESCIKKDSEINRLKWELDCEKKQRLFDRGLCPMNKSLSEEILACVYNCEDCYKRREK